MNTLGHIDVSWVIGLANSVFFLARENLTFTQMSISSDTRLKTNIEPTKMMVGRLYFPFEMTRLSRGQFVSFRKCRLPEFYLDSGNLRIAPLCYPLKKQGHINSQPPFSLNKLYNKTLGGPYFRGAWHRWGTLRFP